MTILLVEDNEADRRVFQEAFNAVCEGGTLHMVEDGEKALYFLFNKEEYATSPTPDLIILDLNLPRTQGHDVLKALKTHPDKKNIPVIVLTSSSSQSDIRTSYNLNASCYLTKPMRFADLLKLMKLICDFWLKEVHYCHP